MKVEVELSAFTRVYFYSVIEVPDNTSKDELKSLVNDLYDEVDGGDYTDDQNFWEKGLCTVHVVSEQPGVEWQPSMTAKQVKDIETDEILWHFKDLVK